ncbi:hypothetical protein RRF57_012517 [Xylaria bambusicola]|uniref:Uncharacterized protein n=1 Tax=Xylaria bambusicola TaxID=326684 RepID=A0AAN7UPV9_9PEZI
MVLTAILSYLPDRSAKSSLALSWSWSLWTESLIFTGLWISLGPNVLLTKSPTAMAPTKAERRAFSPFSSIVPSSKI